MLYYFLTTVLEKGYASAVWMINEREISWWNNNTWTKHSGWINVSLWSSKTTILKENKFRSIETFRSFWACRVLRLKSMVYEYTNLCVTFHLLDLKVGIIWLLMSSLALQLLTPKRLNNCSTWERPMSSSEENRAGWTVDRSLSSTVKQVCSWDLAPGKNAMQWNKQLRDKRAVEFTKSCETDEQS